MKGEKKGGVKGVEEEEGVKGVEEEGGVKGVEEGSEGGGGGRRVNLLPHMP